MKGMKGTDGVAGPVSYSISRFTRQQIVESRILTHDSRDRARKCCVAIVLFAVWFVVIC